MLKRFILAIVAVFIAWMVLDMIIHGMILSSTYASLTNLFRPEAEMSMTIIYIVCIISAAAFVTIYQFLINPKTMKNALLYGLIFGVASGVSMGYGTYATMPIPYNLALAWFLGTIVELVVAGAIVGSIIRATPLATAAAATGAAPAAAP